MLIKHVNIIIFLLFALTVLLMLDATVSESDTVQLEDALYCEMVGIYQETNGKYGWPPYKGDCPDDQNH